MFLENLGVCVNMLNKIYDNAIMKFYECYIINIHPLTA